MIVALVGATGTGKSALSLALAQHWAARGIAAEVVNADAMQLYRGMDIGTAKLPAAERTAVPHHLIDVLDVTDEASVARYQHDARAAIEGILARGAVPILVGGSGLYLAAVLTDFRFPGTDPERRAHWESELAQRGPGALHAVLVERDPVAAAAIGPHNGRRIVRALEVGDLTGEPFSAGLAARERPWRPYRQFGLDLDRATLVARLDERVRGMWRDGLLDEVRGLLPLGLERGVTASRAIGYAQAIAQLHGELDEAEAIAQTQSLTRRYARRQVGWFRRDASIETLDAAADDLAAQVDHRVADLLAASMGG
ncbi:tRNA (adenosine(37)-N6)-dimethylallyltransferase MiaA [Microcella humidisoli]|uniref:tRNA dimethylallyltransferase n=1 Tax=Microcella humidisoli TaxID=2963406 RepID=A0ABY5FUT4_9MICO|nr:tRNA (adenosine(37)-N6)-dimethylallyltransferase MiaA [Microcella humidisoli]UTT62067.1 tRNA (adenosine(37)-N6)-dimethylallyltransferase MiaA [Microcella humidisoli]